jgi:hypothetical protein
VLTAFVAAVIYIVRGAVATAVQQAAARELETLRHTFTRELEEARQTFTRQIEQERADAQRALEGFKAELTLAAETRRHVAAARVKALGELAESGSLLLLRVSEAAPSNPESVRRFREECMRLVATASRLAYLFSPGTGDLIMMTAALLSENAGKAVAGATDATWSEVKKHAAATAKWMTDLAREQAESRSDAAALLPTATASASDH